jgi:hypothetical protein
MRSILDKGRARSYVCADEAHPPQQWYAWANDPQHPPVRVNGSSQVRVEDAVWTRHDARPVRRNGVPCAAAGPPRRP